MTDEESEMDRLAPDCSCGYAMAWADGAYICAHDDYPCDEKNCIECLNYNRGQARKRATS